MLLRLMLVLQLQLVRFVAQLWCTGSMLVPLAQHQHSATASLHVPLACQQQEPNVVHLDTCGRCLAKLCVTLPSPLSLASEWGVRTSEWRHGCS